MEKVDWLKNLLIKSLIMFFLGFPLHLGCHAADQREEFARQLQREMKIPLPRADDWGDLFWHLISTGYKKEKSFLF